MELTPRESLQSKEQRGSLVRFKNSVRDKENNKKKRALVSQVTENRQKIENARKEEEILKKAIFQTYCELFHVKDQNLIKKTSTLEMMSKIDSEFEKMVTGKCRWEMLLLFCGAMLSSNVYTEASLLPSIIGLDFDLKSEEYIPSEDHTNQGILDIRKHWTRLVLYYDYI